MKGKTLVESLKHQEHFRAFNLFTNLFSYRLIGASSRNVSLIDLSFLGRQTEGGTIEWS